VGGLLAAHLPGFSETPAVAALMGAGVVSILRLPLSSVVIALRLTSKAGLGVAPLIIVAVTVAYSTTEVLSERRVSAAQSTVPLDSQAAATAADR
jgi:chloride channel protein, CIC family